MCDPITAIVGAISGAAALFGNRNKPNAAATPPPPPVIPATPPSTARTPGADVKVGDGVDPTSASSTPQYDGFTEKRTFGKPLGGLGRGGLGL